MCENTEQPQSSTAQKEDEVQSITANLANDALPNYGNIYKRFDQVSNTNRGHARRHSTGDIIPFPFSNEREEDSDKSRSQPPASNLNAGSISAMRLTFQSAANMVPLVRSQPSQSALPSPTSTRRLKPPLSIARTRTLPPPLGMRSKMGYGVQSRIKSKPYRMPSFRSLKHDVGKKEGEDPDKCV